MGKLGRSEKNQPKEQYSHPDAFYKTVTLVKNLPNGKFIDTDYANSINFFENLVDTNKSFCICSSDFQSMALIAWLQT